MNSAREPDLAVSALQSSQLHQKLRVSQAEYVVFKAQKEEQITRLIRDNQALRASTHELEGRVADLEAELRFQAENIKQNGYFSAWENVRANTQELQCDLSFNLENRALKDQVMNLKGTEHELRELIERKRIERAKEEQEIKECSQLCAKWTDAELQLNSTVENTLSAESEIARERYVTELSSSPQKIELTCRVLCAEMQALRGVISRLQEEYTRDNERQLELIASGQIYEESGAFIEQWMAEAPTAVSFGRYTEMQVRRFRQLEDVQKDEIAKLEETNCELLVELEKGTNLKAILRTNYVFRDFIAKLAPEDDVVEALGEYFLKHAEEVDTLLEDKDALTAKIAAIGTSLRNTTEQYDNTLEKLTTLQIQYEQQQEEEEAAIAQQSRDAKYRITELTNQVEVLEMQIESKDKAFVDEMQSSLTLAERKYESQQELLESSNAHAETQYNDMKSRYEAECDQLRNRVTALSAELVQQQSIIAKQQMQLLQKATDSDEELENLTSKINNGLIFAEDNEENAIFVEEIMWDRQEPFIDVVRATIQEYKRDLEMSKAELQGLLGNEKSANSNQVSGMYLLQQLVKCPELSDFLGKFDGNADTLVEQLAAYIGTLSHVQPIQTGISVADLRSIAPWLPLEAAETAHSQLCQHVMTLKHQSDEFAKVQLEPKPEPTDQGIVQTKYSELKDKYHALEKQYEELKKYTLNKKEQCNDEKEQIEECAKQLSDVKLQIKKLRSQFNKEYIDQLIKNRPQNITHVVLQQLLDDELRLLNDSFARHSGASGLDAREAADYAQKRRILIENAASALSHLTYFAMTVDRKQNKKYEDAGVLELFVAVCQLSDNKELLGMRICGARELADQIGRELKFMYESRQEVGEEVFQIVKWAQKIAEGVGR